MAKNTVADYSKTASQNTDIAGVDIDEGCSPAGVNNAIREVMADIAAVYDGTQDLASPDINGGTIDGATINNSAIGGTTAAAGSFTQVNSSGAVIATGSRKTPGKICSDPPPGTSRATLRSPDR